MTHTLILPSGDAIHYQLERRTRRTVGLKISATGLIIHAPKRISQAHLESILLLKADWILKKLEARIANQVPALQWQDSEQLFLLGNQITLALTFDNRSRAVRHLKVQKPLNLCKIPEQGTAQNKNKSYGKDHDHCSFNVARIARMKS